MYQDLAKLTQDTLKPFIKLSENNTALTVKLLKSQSDKVSEILQNNLTYVQTLIETKDLNVALDLQKKYLETLNETLFSATQQNIAAIEGAVKEAGNIYKESLSEAKTQAKQAAGNVEQELNKVSTKVKTQAMKAAGNVEQGLNKVSTKVKAQAKQAAENVEQGLNKVSAKVKTQTKQAAEDIEKGSKKSDTKAA